MKLRHGGASPKVDPSAYVAPGVVFSGDVRIGAHSRVLFGAVLTAEGGTITIGEHCVVMENAVLRSTAHNDLVVGDHCIIGPRSYVVGAVIEQQVFLATGCCVFNGALVGAGSEVRINGIVHVRTTLPPGTTVPIGWIAAGTPAGLFSPDQHDALWAVQQTMDFPAMSSIPITPAKHRWWR